MSQYQAAHGMKAMDYESVCGMTQEDRELLQRLQDFLPDRIFDAHAHLHNLAYVPQEPSLFTVFGTADARRLLADQKTIYGDRKFRALLLPTPTALFRQNRPMRKEMNCWMAEQMEDAPDCVGAIYVMPGDTVEDIEAMMLHPRIRGLKCYHQTANADNTFYCRIGEYLPESAWQVADRHGMTITLHMVRPKALADADNMAYIKEMTSKYPNAKLILAHCARGFASWTTIERVRELRGIPNLYYDMAAITDPATMYELIRQAGPDRVMWGSDYCIDRAHGKPVNMGESFRWLYLHELPEGVEIPACMTILESLFAFYQASLMLDASREDIEKIFYGTGAGLFGLD